MNLVSLTERGNQAPYAARQPIGFGGFDSHRVQEPPRSVRFSWHYRYALRLATWLERQAR